MPLNIVSFSKIEEETKPKKLQALIGKKVVINKIWIDYNEYGQQLVYFEIEGKTYFSNSKVIKQQAERIIKYLEEHKEVDAVEVEIVGQRNYYMFR